MEAIRCGFVGCCLLALNACAAVDNFQLWEVRKGPVPVGPEWSEIRCPDPIVTSAPFQSLLLLIPVGSDIPNFHDQVIVFDRDGKRVALEAEIVDTDGRVYSLDRWKGNISFPNRVTVGPDKRTYYYTRLTSKDLPLTLRFNVIRLRSSSPIVLQDVLWQTNMLGP